MKALIILILGFSSFLSESYSGNEIDFSPRLLHKELGKLSCNEDFRINEVQIQGSANTELKPDGKFFSLTCSGTDKFLAYIGRVYCCRAGGCSSTADINFESEYEYFDYFILFDSQKKIVMIRVFNYEATHGQEIMSKGWLNQFTGFDGNKTLRVGKEIDSISGATISVNGLTADVQKQSSLLKLLTIR